MQLKLPHTKPGFWDDRNKNISSPVTVISIRSNGVHAVFNDLSEFRNGNLQCTRHAY